MKLGLDMHGVIDRHPMVFSMMAKNVIDNGGEVHIIVGMTEDQALLDLLKLHDIPYTEIFSITDQLLFEEHENSLDENVRVVFNDSLWNQAKGAYCSLWNIDIHFDDTEEYSKYFTTPFFLWDKSCS